MVRQVTFENAHAPSTSDGPDVQRPMVRSPTSVEAASRGDRHPRHFRHTSREDAASVGVLPGVITAFIQFGMPPSSHPYTPYIGESE